MRGLAIWTRGRRLKRQAELDWWANQAELEGQLHHAHYERLFTEPFDLARDYFTARSILDIGCGPRGSLEWADDARERIGLDPLADEYRELGADRHRMAYVAGRAEAIPFPEGRFDVVSSFNSFDHVENERRVAAEITRVLAPGGIVLLIVEVNHAPTTTEPLKLGWNLTQLFSPALRVEQERRLERGGGGVHDAVLLDPVPFNTGGGREQPGILIASLRHARD